MCVFVCVRAKGLHQVLITTKLWHNVSHRYVWYSMDIHIQSTHAIVNTYCSVHGHHEYSLTSKELHVRSIATNKVHFQLSCIIAKYIQAPSSTHWLHPLHVGSTHHMLAPPTTCWLHPLHVGSTHHIKVFLDFDLGHRQSSAQVVVVAVWDFQERYAPGTEAVDLV